MAKSPDDHALMRKKEILQEFADAQAGFNYGARPGGEIEGTTIGHQINRRISTTLKASSILGQALRDAGRHPPGPGYHAHHIVPSGDPEAEEARNILASAGIGINDAINGVWLPGTSKTVNVDGSFIHQGIHSPEYCRHITRIIKQSVSEEGSNVDSALLRLSHRIQEAEEQVRSSTREERAEAAQKRSDE